MASALLDHLSPADIEQQIQTEISKLASSKRNTPDRHRSLWGVFAYSYQQLNLQAQQSFCQLSIFTSRFNAAAASAIADASPQILALLVNQSLLKEVPTDDQAQAGYEMHRLLKQFAIEQMSHEPKLVSQLEERYLVYFIKFIYERVDSIRQGGPPAIFHEMDAAIDDIRLVWQKLITRLAAEASNHDELFNLFRSAAITGEHVIEHALEGLLSYYFAKGWLSEGLELTRSLNTLRIDNALTLRGRLWEAEFLAGIGEYQSADQMFNGVLERSQHIDGSPIRAEALNGLGRVKYLQGDMGAAKQLFESGLQFARMEEDPILISLALNCLANTVAEAEMAYQETASLLSESLEISAAAGDQLGEARALVNLGILAQEQDELQKAKALYEKSLNLYQKIGYQHGIAAALKYLGHIANKNEDFSTARELLQQSIELSIMTGDRRSEADCLRQMGNIERSQSRFNEALGQYEAALAIAQTIGGDLLALGILCEIGEAHRLDDQPEAAAAISHYVLSHPAVGDEVSALARDLLAKIEVVPVAHTEDQSLSLGQMIEVALAP
ncbi:MAG: tetratricopeptide repeat protein, partial [Chloroflexota bacterium]